MSKGNLMMSDGTPFWISKSYLGNEIPENAVKAGMDNNEIIYVGRARHCGSVTPGKILKNHPQHCIIPWGCISNEKNDFEYLISTEELQWVQAEGGSVPDNAFPGGNSETGEVLYIGRVKHNGTITVGKIQPSHRVCYIAYGEQELNFRNYEVLVV